MSCRRVRREILEIVRFGDVGPGSAGNLEHLSRCADCRDEVGLDRALVAQLRRALAARVDDATPPTRAWYAILREAQRPEPRMSPWAWLAGSLVGRLRTATAMAGTGLAVVLAMNMEVIPVQPAPEPAGASRAEEVTLQQVPRMPTGRTMLVALANLSDERSEGTVDRPDPEQQLMEADARVSPRPRADEEPEDALPADEPESSGPVLLLVRPLQTPEMDAAAAGAAADDRDVSPEPRDEVDMARGAPS